MQQIINNAKLKHHKTETNKDRTTCQRTAQLVKKPHNL